MKKYFSILVLLIISNFHAQTYKINDFSKDYSAIITPNEKDDDGYSLKIIDNKTKKTLVNDTVYLDEYDFEDTSSNIRELPYGHQSIIIFDDFNFDDKKDIAIKYGNQSCYGGPSYNVYLSNNQGFKYSEAFSELAQNYCGFFSIDEEKKEIYTVTKSGCCWHQFSAFVVKNGKPFLINQLEEEYNGNHVINTIKKWDGTKYITTTEKTIGDEEFETAIFRYQMENGKYLVLYLGGNQRLYYYFLDKNMNLELEYEDTFFYSKSSNSITFDTGDAEYKIFNDRIEVLYNNKLTVLKANTKTRKNNISDIYSQFKDALIENLEIVD